MCFEGLLPPFWESLPVVDQWHGLLPAAAAVSDSRARQQHAVGDNNVETTMCWTFCRCVHLSTPRDLPFHAFCCKRTHNATHGNLRKESSFRVLCCRILWCNFFFNEGKRCNQITSFRRKAKKEHRYQIFFLHQEKQFTIFKYSFVLQFWWAKTISFAFPSGRRPTPTKWAQGNVVWLFFHRKVFGVITCEKYRPLQFNIFSPVPSHVVGGFPSGFAAPN